MDVEVDVAVMRCEPLSDENGRGLFLVDALAHDWGSELGHGGKRVWAELRSGSAPECPLPVPRDAP